MEEEREAEMPENSPAWAPLVDVVVVPLSDVEVAPRLGVSFYDLQARRPSSNVVGCAITLISNMTPLVALWTDVQDKTRPPHSLVFKQPRQARQARKRVPRSVQDDRQ